MAVDRTALTGLMEVFQVFRKIQEGIYSQPRALRRIEAIQLYKQSPYSLRRSGVSGRLSDLFRSIVHCQYYISVYV